MLIINVNGNRDLEMDPDGWFENVFDETLLMEDFSKRMLREVAQCEVISPNLVISDVLGAVPPEWIGSGCKAVLVMKYSNPGEDGIVNLHWCGNNLIPYIREVVDSKDVEVNSNILFPIFSKGYGEYRGKVMVKNSGKVFSSGIELFDEILKYMNQG